MQHDAGTNTPLTWVEHVAHALQWPVIVGAAFWLGRYVQRLETRVVTAERSLKMLIERHLPQVHRALSEIRGKIETVLALVQRS